MTHIELQIELQIEFFRRTIPHDGATAQSINRNDSWSRLAHIARSEGYLQFARMLEQADHNLRSGEVRIIGGKSQWYDCVEAENGSHRVAER